LGIFSQRSVGLKRARRQRGPAASRCAGPCPRLQAAVGPVTGAAESRNLVDAPPPKALPLIFVSLIHFLASFFIRLLVVLSFRLSLIVPSPFDAATNVKGRLVRNKMSSFLSWLFVCFEERRILSSYLLDSTHVTPRWRGGTSGAPSWSPTRGSLGHTRPCCTPRGRRSRRRRSRRSRCRRWGC
jgi:hypothetical protein